MDRWANSVFCPMCRFQVFAEATRRIDTHKLNSHVLIVFNYFFPQFPSNSLATPWEGDELVFMVSPKQGTHFIGGKARASKFAGEALSMVTRCSIRWPFMGRFLSVRFQVQT